MSQDDHVRAMLDLVESYRETKCDELQSAARTEARKLLQHARRAAHERVRQAFTLERNGATEKVALAEARLRTRRRLHEQRNRAALLRECWALLLQELARRWADATSRQVWIDHLVAHAGKSLPRGEWRIAHPTGWPAEEQQRLAAQLEGRAEFSADEEITAGLRLACGHNVVDGTVAGLLVDRDVIEARLLQHLEGSAA